MQTAPRRASLDTAINCTAIPVKTIRLTETHDEKRAGLIVIVAISETSSERERDGNRKPDSCMWKQQRQRRKGAEAATKCAAQTRRVDVLYSTLTLVHIILMRAGSSRTESLKDALIYFSNPQATVEGITLQKTLTNTTHHTSIRQDNPQRNQSNQQLSGNTLREVKSLEDFAGVSIFPDPYCNHPVCRIVVNQVPIHFWVRRLLLRMATIISWAGLIGIAQAAAGIRSTIIEPSVVRAGQRVNFTCIMEDNIAFETGGCVWSGPRQQVAPRLAPSSSGIVAVGSSSDRGTCSFYIEQVDERLHNGDWACNPIMEKNENIPSDELVWLNLTVAGSPRVRQCNDTVTDSFSIVDSFICDQQSFLFHTGKTAKVSILFSSHPEPTEVRWIIPQLSQPLIGVASSKGYSSTWGKADIDDPLGYWDRSDLYWANLSIKGYSTRKEGDGFALEANLTNEPLPL
ncbi:unnamed protein product [Notodromas monacha]|uniref:Uncharacterized protein n=1 Tax=Notodromas monacha TaxID=399045 RepID=A0A7R9GG96_9CRUS|nr:unnamed protein product [Notodromas monacha]CAG0919736.1 unnamed protein product [Notodromas monacha]